MYVCICIYTCIQISDLSLRGVDGLVPRVSTPFHMTQAVVGPFPWALVGPFPRALVWVLTFQEKRGMLGGKRRGSWLQTAPSTD